MPELDQLDDDEREALDAIVAFLRSCSEADIVAALGLEECAADAREFAQKKAAGLLTAPP